MGDNLPDQPQEQNVGSFDQELPFNEKDHRARTASRLAWVVLSFLGVGYGAHYAAVLYMVLTGRLQAEELAKAFDKILPVLTTFCGAAVTYYLTSREKS